MRTFDDSTTATSHEEILPFRVEIASLDHMQEVADLRCASYGKHLPELAQKLARPEPEDYRLGCEVFVARSKLDGSLLGTLRTHANAYAPLPLEASIQLPKKFFNTRMVETTRLCIKGNGGASVVRTALFKAVYQYGVAQNADWMMVTGRRPVDRLYEALLFNDIGAEGTYYSMSHVSGVPHRVMYVSPIEAEQRWRLSGHPFYQFFATTHHPDIDISNADRLIFDWGNYPQTSNVTSFDRRRKPTRPSDQEYAFSLVRKCA